MAIKLADTLAPMADFPAAMAEHVEFSDGENLQEKLDNEGLGAKNPIECTFEEYKQLDADGLVESDRDYIITSNESGVLLTSTDVAYNDTLTVKGKFDEVDEAIDGLIDDENTSTDTVWSSQKTSDEIAEVETKLPNIKKFISPNGTVRYITISAHALGDIEIHSAYAGKYMFTSSGSTPIFFGTSTYRGYTLTGWAWNADNTVLYLRVNGHMDFVVSAFGSDRVTISNMTTSAPDGITFNATFETNALASQIVGTKTQYIGSQSVDINTGGKMTFIFSSTYSTSAGAYLLLSNYNVTPTLIELGRHPEKRFSVTVTNKSAGIDTITVTIPDEYHWYILQF